MAAGNIVTDPFLHTVLDAADLARRQSLHMLDLLSELPQSARAPMRHDMEMELSRNQKLLYTRLAEVRGLNRNALIGVRQTKQATAEARQEVDMLHLRLQNLYYEQRHLRGEIAACESYQ